MKLRGIEFGNVLGASGVQGFFGEGYWYHHPWKRFGLDFSGMTFVSKTTTPLSRDGNMPLTDAYVPLERFPKCVRVQFCRGHMLNAVGLSGPGLSCLLATGHWQRRKLPFFISVMSVSETANGRLDEMKAMVDVIGSCKDDFSAPLGLQINLSCPNAGHDPRELIRESMQMLEIANRLHVPLMPKYSVASAPIEAMLELERLPFCDAICVSNTLPFGWKGIDWKGVWRSEISPLKQYGGGGLSGKLLCPIVCSWISRLRNAGFTKPINGGGGILSVDDVDAYHRVNVDSVFLGSVAALRPWRVKRIIKHIQTRKWR